MNERNLMFAAMLGGFEILFMLAALLMVPVGLAIMAFWIWMLVHAAQNKGLSDGEKVAWILIIALVHFLGALIYFFVGRPKARLTTASPEAV